MKKIKLLLVNTIKLATSKIQVKGMPKVIVWTKKRIFSKNEVYRAYNNIKLKINPDVNFHCLNVLNYGGYEAVKIFEKYLKPGDVYVDIGTNFGYMSLNAEKIVGKSGKVISFEPDVEILPLLKENKKINDSNIMIVEKAVSDKKGTAVFNIATESGLSRLNNVKDNLLGLELLKKNEVEIDTLDDVLNEIMPKRPVKMIKIDVEGHELKVLKGGYNTIKNYKPVFLMEINHEALLQNNVTYKDILNFFEEFSYTFYYLESHAADWFRFGRNPTVKPLNEYTDESLKNKPFDLICVCS